MGIKQLPYCKLEPDVLKQFSWFHEDKWSKILNIQIYWGVPFSFQAVALKEIKKAFGEYYYGAITCSMLWSKEKAFVVILKDKPRGNP